MSKVTVKNKKGKIIITNKLSYPEAVNERVYNAIASGMFEGVLPVSIRQKGKETRLECVALDMIPLAQYFGGIVTRKMFLDVVHEIALLIKSCEKNMVNANNLELQSDKIFVDPQTLGVKCIFWPIVNNQRGNPPHLFLKQLPNDLSFSPHENNVYIGAYKAFFNGMQPFSVNSFDRLILKLLGKQSDDCSTASDLPTGALSDHAKSDKKEPDTKRNVNIEYDPLSAYARRPDIRKPERETVGGRDHVGCSSCGATNLLAANFCGRCGAPLKATKPAAAVATTSSGHGKPEKPKPPKLIHLRTKKAYPVNKPIFRIGASKHTCDLLICNNYISRNHADIVTQGGRYYIMDHNSTNKTFVNGSAVPGGTGVEIFSGTQIRLANEEFIFNIE